jgi:hypothetical protein
VTVVTLRPDATVASNDVTPTGGTQHAVLADNNDATYITFSVNAAATDQSFPAAAVPAGAIVKQLALRLRSLRTSPGTSLLSGQLKLNGAGDTLPAASQAINWTSAVTATAVTWSLDDAARALLDPDAFEVVASLTSGGSLRALALYVDLTYVAQPALTVDGPSGTTDSSEPAITWTAALDADGGAQTKYEVKAFTEDDATAGGFDPATSAAAAGSGVTAGAATLWVTSSLPDDSYRAYVRVAQTIAGTVLWSDWAYGSFVVDAVTPSPPTLTVSVQHALARVALQMSDPGSGDVPADRYVVQRSIDAGATWQPVRTADGGAISSNDTIYDTEVGNGVEVRHRARCENITDQPPLVLASTWTESDPTAWHHLSWWLKSATHPGLNTAVETDSQPSMQRPVRRGVFQPLGRRDAIVISDTPGPWQGTIVIYAADADARDAIDALLALGEPLLLQGVPGNHWDDRYVSFGDHDRARSVDKAWIAGTGETLPWIEVTAPSGDVVAWPRIGWTIDDMEAAFTGQSIGDLEAAFATIGDLEREGAS